MFQRLQNGKRFVFGVVLAILILSSTHWLWVNPHVRIKQASSFHNAAWAGVEWTSLPLNEYKISALGERACAYQIDYLYVFTTYIKPNGEFSPSYQYARDFVHAFREINSSTKLLAWVGVPVLSMRPFSPPGWVDLTKDEERQKIVSFVANLIEESGFDGVHLDVEHVDDGDQAYLALLREMRSAIGPGKILSVAGNDWVPDLINKMPVVGGYKWGSRYYRQVSQEVDQIATMTYDSFSPWAWVYRWWMREQVIGISCSVREPGKLLIGISISRERTATHDPNAENMDSGLSGVIAALDSSRSCSEPISGVAIYAWWEARQEDWQAWKARWLSGN